VHAVTMREAAGKSLEQMWRWYTELAIWSLILMALSGVYLWLASRPAYGWGQISFVAGAAHSFCFMR